MKTSYVKQLHSMFKDIKVENFKNIKVENFKNESKFKFEKTIEYHFSEESKSPYFSVHIPIEKIRVIYDTLKEKFGETETIKEYSLYKFDDLVLTVYPDGSSYCNRQIKTELKRDSILVLQNEKYKNSNDSFPSKYNYHSILDIVDVIFTIKDIKIVLSSIYEHSTCKVKTIESLGRPAKISKSKNAWCELYISAECNSTIEDVNNTITLLQLFFPPVSTSQT